MLYNALIAVAGFLLGLRVGLAVGYRSERGRRIVHERAFLRQLARVLGARVPEMESIEAARTRLLDEARDRDRRDLKSAPDAPDAT